MDAPIGLFDSGVGGLTVLKEVIRELPLEDVIYFGDVARTPYGSKSKEVVIRFSREITSFLIRQGVKLIIIACNTVSSVALETLSKEFEVPILGVIEPGVIKAVEMTREKRIGVIGTRATISSGSYVEAIRGIDPKIRVISQPCPLFVPLVEEGWVDHKVARLIADEYLSPLKENGVDVVILGCTHYPFLKPLIQEVMGDRVVLVDSAVETAKLAKRLLKERMLLRKTNLEVSKRFYLSDISPNFIQLGEKLLGEKMRVVTMVDVSRDV